MRRRAFLTCVATVSGATHAQSAREALPMPPGGRPWRIGWLFVAREVPYTQRAVAAFHEAMRERGWELGRHYVVEARRADGDARRIPALAAELVAAAPDLLIGPEPVALAYRRHTTTQPIVMWGSDDPVAAGLVSSLARPGTNVTGISNMMEALVTKNVEALFEIVPQARRIALLYETAWAGAERSLDAARRLAGMRGTEVLPIGLSAEPRSVAEAFAAVDRERVEAVVLGPGVVIFHRAEEISAELLRRRLPATGPTGSGGIASHAVDAVPGMRDTADFVDRILRGAKPAELPVRQMMTVRLYVAPRRAREIGVALPVSLRVRADEVIE